MSSGYKELKELPTSGEWYVAEKARWNADVRFIRTSEDASGVVGVINDRDAKLVSASRELLDACKAALALRSSMPIHEEIAIRANIEKAIRKAEA